MSTSPTVLPCSMLRSPVALLAMLRTVRSMRMPSLIALGSLSGPKMNRPTRTMTISSQPPMFSKPIAVLLSPSPAYAPAPRSHRAGHRHLGGRPAPPAARLTLRRLDQREPAPVDVPRMPLLRGSSGENRPGDHYFPGVAATGLGN